MKTHTMNRSTCSICNDDGLLLKCCFCPRAFHSKCLSSSDGSSKIKNSSKWRCSYCSDNQSQNCLSENNKHWYQYLRMFDVGSLDDNEYENIPSVGMLLLALEWILSLDLLPAVATCVCKYFSDNRRFEGVDSENMTKLFTESSHDLTSYTNLIEQLRSIVDSVSLDEILAKLINNMDASAIGLASSYQVFCQPCPTCTICRYLRSFCFNCGHIFDVSVDLNSDLVYIIANSSCLSELAVEMETESTGISSVYLLQESVRGTNVNSTTLNAVTQDRNDGGSAAPSSVPVIDTSSSKKRGRYADQKAARDARYSEVAFRAITQLQSLGRDQGKDGFETHGGDMLFLTRNLATNCTGLHRAYSRRVFAELCDRWVKGNPGLSALQGGEHDVHCIVEVLATLTQLVDGRSRSYMMFSEPEPADIEERLRRVTEWRANLSVCGDSSRQKSKERRVSDAVTAISSSSSSSHRSSLSAEDQSVQSMKVSQKMHQSDVSTSNNARESLVDLTSDSEGTATVQSVVPVVIITPARIKMKPRAAKSNVSTMSTVTPFTINDTNSESSSDIQVGCESKAAILSVASTPSSDSRSASSEGDSSSAISPFESSGMGDIAGRVIGKKSSVSLAPRQPLTRRAKERGAACLSEELLVDLLTGAAAQHPELFDYRIFLDNYRAALPDPSQCNSLMELICFDPKSEQVPFTPTSHCRNCGVTHGSKIKKAARGARNSSAADDSADREVRKSCKNCGVEAASVVDFSALTDALCWAYLFKCVGLDVDLHTPQADSLPKIIRLLPMVRTYSTLLELGEDFYKWQCYFITHLIYAFSDYGQHALRRQLFAEEFEFMATQMIIAIVQLRDPEIVGEFIHCLKILQYTEESDPQLAVIIRHGMDFLVETERSLGAEGLFVARSADFKDRYHASYCGAVGLLDSPFSENVADRLSPPAPRLLSFI